MSCAPAVERDQSGGNVLESGNHAQRRGFAAPRRSQQRDDLALPDVHVERAHRMNGRLAATAVDLVDTSKLEHAHLVRLPSGRLSPMRQANKLSIFPIEQ